MAEKKYYLTEEDVRRLRAMMDEHDRQPKNQRNRPASDRQDYLTPEVYVARTPAAGIPGYDENTPGTGTGSAADDVFAYADCAVYRLADDNTLDPAGITRRIYNLTSADIDGFKWILVARDKFGRWFAIHTNIDTCCMWQEAGLGPAIGGSGAQANFVGDLVNIPVTGYGLLRYIIPATLIYIPKNTGRVNIRAGVTANLRMNHALWQFIWHATASVVAWPVYINANGSYAGDVFTTRVLSDGITGFGWGQSTEPIYRHVIQGQLARLYHLSLAGWTGAVHIVPTATDARGAGYFPGFGDFHKMSSAGSGGYALDGGGFPRYTDYHNLITWEGSLRNFEFDMVVTDPVRMAMAVSAEFGYERSVMDQVDSSATLNGTLEIRDINGGGTFLTWDRRCCDPVPIIGHVNSPPVYGDTTGTGTYEPPHPPPPPPMVPPIPPTYNCVDGACVDPGNGSGEFATLEECQNECITTSYDCIDGECIEVLGNNGTYATIEACIAACTLQTSGPRTAGTATTTGIGVDWTGAGNTTADDGSYATATLSAGQATRTLRLTNFGFALPGSANSIRLQLDMRRFCTAGNFKDVMVQLVQAGSLIGDNKADTGSSWPTSEAPKQYGSNATPLYWGITLTQSMLNDPTFGVDIIVNENGFSGGDANIDLVTMTASYFA